MLIKRISLTLFDKSPWSYPSETAENGKRTGFRYKGFDREDKIWAFNTLTDKFPIYNIGSFEETKAREFDLAGSEFSGVVKWWDADDKAKATQQGHADRVS